MRAVLPLLPKVKPPRLPNCPKVKVMGALKLVLSGWITKLPAPE